MVKDLLGLSLNTRLQSWCSAFYAYMGMTRRPTMENNVARPLELPYECPHSGFQCSVIGNISELAKHLKDDHNVPQSDHFSSPPRDGYEFILKLNHSRSGDLQNPCGMYAVSYNLSN